MIMCDRKEYQPWLWGGGAEGKEEEEEEGGLNACSGMGPHMGGGEFKVV